MIANVLSIAGSDPSGGAGIQADLKTFSALGCYGMAVITALTAQNTRGVTGVHVPPADFIALQIDAIFADVRVDAVKIGMLASGEIAAIVADRLKAHGAKNIVLDPVLVATSGDALGAPDVVDAMRRHLFPIATLITPNVPEAERLSGFSAGGTQEGLQKVARDLAALDARAVLVKGGHLDTATADDVLLEGGHFQTFSAPRVETDNTHGTGCTLSSAIACYLAKGHTLRDAVGAAKTYLTQALKASDAIDVGGGHGPVHHFHAWWK